jgi:hypothetical protein
MGQKSVPISKNAHFTAGVTAIGRTAIRDRPHHEANSGGPVETAHHARDRTFCVAETRLPGWACRIRTSESVRELSGWNSVTTWPEEGANPAAQTLACELRDMDLQLRPRLSRRSLTRRAAFA